MEMRRILALSHQFGKLDVEIYGAGSIPVISAGRFFARMVKWQTRQIQNLVPQGVQVQVLLRVLYASVVERNTRQS